MGPRQRDFSEAPFPIQTSTRTVAQSCPARKARPAPGTPQPSQATKRTRKVSEANLMRRWE